MSVKMILCTGLLGELGYSDGRLAFHCKEDMQYFRKQTLNQNVVMGRKTFDSIGLKNGLPDRVNYVVTRTPDIPSNLAYEECTMEGMRNRIKVFEGGMCKDTWVIGGKEIYTQMLDIVTEVHHTTIQDTNHDAAIFLDMSFLYEGEWCKASTKWLVEDSVSVSVWKRK